MWKIDPDRDSLWLAIAFPGALVNLTNGQNGFLTLALLGAALLTLERRPILAGVLFGLMSYKPQYGLLVPIFLIATGRWRAIAAASVTVALLAALSFAMFGAQTWQAFFASIAFTRHVVLEQGGSGFEKLQSAFAAARLWGFSVATAYAFQAAVSLIAADCRHLDLAANRELRTSRRRARNRRPADDSLYDGLRPRHTRAADRVDCARRPRAQASCHGRNRCSHSLAAAAVRALTRRPRKDSNRTTHDAPATSRRRPPRRQTDKQFAFDDAALTSTCVTGGGTRQQFARTFVEHPHDLFLVDIQ